MTSGKIVTRATLNALSIASVATMAWASVQAAPVAEPKSVVFHCHVVEGPALTACTPKEKLDLSPEKAANVKARIERTPYCFLTGLTPGTEVDRPFRYLDTPELAQPGYGNRIVAITNPDWDIRPTPQMMLDVYPKTAAAAKLTGRAVLNCELDAQGLTKTCTVVSEDPIGFGFGEAANQLMTMVKFKPKLVDCRPVDGGKISVPINFRFPDN